MILILMILILIFSVLTFLKLSKGVILVLVEIAEVDLFLLVSDDFDTDEFDSDNFGSVTFDSDFDPNFNPDVVSDNVSPISVFGTLNPTKFNASAIIPSFTYKS